MPFIPHDKEDVDAMLARIGAVDTNELFDEIPSGIGDADFSNFPDGINENQLSRVMIERAPIYKPGTCFIGAGAYEHHIPAAVWDIATRGEFYTAYTPYQAEASQGTLQVIYEYQSMMSDLMDMDVSNASLYDGASSLAEAVLMALRIKRGKQKRILVPVNSHPYYREVLDTILQDQDVELVPWRYEKTTGGVDINQLKDLPEKEFAAVIVSQPNFFGGIEDIDVISDLCHEKQALLIGVVNPLAMALIKPPGQWGAHGADIVCGEGQPMGVPLSGGGPYFGFMCCRKADVRQLPGRLVGRTKDSNGKVGYVLTLQAREQHIRRSKATSNICTNQGLLVTAATIYMRMRGPKGLCDVAATCYRRSSELQTLLHQLDGVSLVFNGPSFHEFVIRTSKPIDLVAKKLKTHGLQPGLVIRNFYPELGDCLLICVTETKTSEDLQRYHEYLSDALT